MNEAEKPEKFILQHALSNIPECKACSDYDPSHGGSCSHGDDDWFTCPKITKHLDSMKKELRQIIQKQDRMMRTIPKHLRAKGHWIDIEIVLGKFRCSEFGNANSSDACLQCPSNSECAKLTCSKTKKKEVSE